MTEQSSSERQAPSSTRSYRTSQACTRCKQAKLSCRPSNDSNLCQRCLDSAKTCDISVIRQDPPRRRGPSRITSLERKIDSLLYRPSREHTVVLREHEKTSSHSPLTNADKTVLLPRTPSKLEETVDFHDFENDKFGRDTSDVDPLSNDDILTTLIESGQANELLQDYRSSTRAFPFVPIDTNTSIHDLSSGSPMLLLAILASSSWRDRDLQSRLEKRFSRELSYRIFVQTSVDISLLQGLLVYLSRYHLYARTCPRHLMPLVSLVSGLALDLKLLNQTKLHCIEQNTPFDPVKFRSRQRTLLGCYYISSTISQALRRSNLLVYTDYMQECCQSLASAAEFPTDVHLWSLIDLCKMDDKISAIISLVGPNPNLDLSMESCIDDIAAQLTHWQNPFSATHELGLLYLHAKIVLYGIQNFSVFSNLDSRPAPATHLHDQLSAAKAFLDTLLAIPTKLYPQMSLAPWLRLPSVLMIIFTFTTGRGIDSPQWDIKAAQDLVRLDLCLESLCYRMQTLTTFKQPEQPNMDFWRAIQLITEKFTQFYSRVASTAKQKVQTPSLSFGSFSTIPTLSDESPPFDLKIDACPVMSISPDVAMPNSPNPTLTSTSPDLSAFMLDFDMTNFIDWGMFNKT